MWLYLSSPNGQRVVEAINRIEGFCEDNDGHMPRGIMGGVAFSEHAGNIVATVSFRDRSPGRNYILNAIKNEFPDVFPGEKPQTDYPDGWIPGWREAPHRSDQSFDWRIKVTAPPYSPLVRLELGGNPIFLNRAALQRALEG